MKNSSQNQSRPILIVDKKGAIGKTLASKLADHFIVVLVSQKSDLSTENIVHVPFLKKIPKIPDNYYSYIFLIENGKILSKSIGSFIKKANKDQSRLILIEGIRNLDQKSIDETKFYRNANTFFYGDLFSEIQILSQVGQELSDIKKLRKIEIEGEGLDKLYPVYLDDFIETLIEEVFVKNNPSKIINVFPSAPITRLSLARLVQSIDPEVKTDFTKKRTKTVEPKIQDGEFVINKYDLRSKIKIILESELPSDFRKNESLSEEIGDKSYLKVGLGFVILFILFFLLLPLITTLFYSGLGLYQIDSLKKDLDRGDLASAYKSANNSKTFFDFAQKTIVPLKSEAAIIGKEGDVNKLSQQIYLGQSISQASSDLIVGSQKIEKVMQGGSQDPKVDFESSASLMKNAISSFRRIEAQSQDYPEISKKISEISPVVDLISNTINILPNILGLDGEKKYLVLFQNNMELRPGGGFIGSYGILKVKNSTFEDLKIYNVYDADGQLKGHIEPPFPIRKYIPQPNWFLRDSNFDVQFINNASQAAYFLNLETGEKVDGVVAIDINFVKDVLSAIGSVNVPDYNVEVDSSNLFKITEEKSEKNSFSGSTQKQDFLSALFKSMDSKIAQDKNLPYLLLAKAISKDLIEKHILLASSNPSVQEQFSANNWSSQMSPTQSVHDSSLEDFLGISEANLGINKVNYFITKTISKAQKIDDSGNLSSTVTLSYKNSGDMFYKNYIRFILPDSITLSQISFDNVAQDILPPQTNPNIYESKSYKPLPGLEVDNYAQDGKTYVGFLIQIPPNSSKDISITYDLNKSLNLGDKISYNLFYFKQPGTTSTPFDLSVYFPSSYSVISKENSSQVLDNKVDLSKNLDSDEVFNLSFGKK